MPATADTTPDTAARRKFVAGAAELPDASAGNVIPGWLSVPAVDRSKEFIDGSDMDLAEFRANPVFLWCHNRPAVLPALGNVPDLSPRTYGGTGFKGLFGNFRFDETDEFAMKVYRKYAAGYMRGFSVGFVPYGWRPMTADELGRAGAPANDRVNRMTRGKLLEASAVPVPDNQLALAVVLKEFGGTISDDLKKTIAEMTPPQSTFAADLTKIFPGGGVQVPAPAATTDASTSGESEPASPVGANAMSKPATAETKEADHPVAETTPAAPPADAKALGTTDDTAGGAVRPYAASCKAGVANVCKTAADLSGLFGASEHPRAAKTHRRAMCHMGKACRVYVKALTDAGDDDADSCRRMADQTFGADEPDADDKPDPDDKGLAPAPDAPGGDDHPADPGALAELHGTVLKVAAALAAMNGAIGEKFEAIEDWQRRLEANAVKQAATFKALSDKLDGLYTLRGGR